jgi:S-adenosylmethionine decarboxylase proenzyme
MVLPTTPTRSVVPVVTNSIGGNNSESVRTIKNVYHYQIRLSMTFAWGAIFVSSVFGYYIGCLSRMHGLGNRMLPEEYCDDSAHPVSDANCKVSRLPRIKLPAGKSFPDSMYTSQSYSTKNVILSHHEILTRQDKNFLSYEVADADSLQRQQKTINNNTLNFESLNRRNTEKEFEDDHQPTGQHLLVDIENVDASFLNSAHQLAFAMVDVIEMSGLTLLSYHCHGLEPIGVSCVGVLLESHVSFHTWPIEGVITLDLFTCGPQPLLPLVPILERLFGVPRVPKPLEGTPKPPRTVWVHKKRGFRRDRVGEADDTADLEHWMLGNRGMQLKKLVATVNTEFQDVSIYDVINTRFASAEAYERSLATDGSYESQHPELFRKDRVLYLDNVVQSRLLGETAYHESLVHPAMFSHQNPRRVAIIGGGEGAALREVLKHRTVEMVTMLEIDEAMVNASRSFLKEWSDCSNIAGASDCCFDDPRAEVVFTDAVVWFVERFGNPDKVDEESRFDVIVMDALASSTNTDFADNLYNSDDMASALFNALTPHGIFVAQVGEHDFISNPRRHLSQSGHLNRFIEHLEEAEFESIREYTESHGNFMSAWFFVVAFKSSETKERWYANEAEVTLEIRSRAVPTRSGSTPFLYFDGASMMTYQFSSRIAKEIFCRNDPAPHFCEEGHEFIPDLPNAPISAFEERQWDIAGAGRGVSFEGDHPKDTYIAFDEGVHDMMVFLLTLQLIKKMSGIDMEYNSLLKIFDIYMFSYGFFSDSYGLASSSVDPGIPTSINHGCNGTNVIGVQDPTITELTVNPFVLPADEPMESTVFNPYIKRNHLIFSNAKEKTSLNVSAWTELTDNYLAYATNEWAKYVNDLKGQCAHKHEDLVTIYKQQESQS